MSILSKTAGGLSMGAALVDIHKTAMKYSNQELAKTSANIVISNSIGAQKSDTFSYKDAVRKNWLSEKNLLATQKEFMGRIKGYFKGVLKTAPRYIPNFVLGIIGLTTKSKTIGKLSAIGLAAVEIYDYIMHATNITQRTDNLNIK